MAASTTPPTTEQRRWWLLVSLCVVAAIAYLQRQVPGTVAKAIQTDLALNKEAMGTVLGAFFFHTLPCRSRQAGYARPGEFASR